MNGEEWWFYEPAIYDEDGWCEVREDDCRLHNLNIKTGFIVTCEFEKHVASYKDYLVTDDGIFNIRWLPYRYIVGDQVKESVILTKIKKYLAGITDE